MRQPLFCRRSRTPPYRFSAWRYQRYQGFEMIPVNSVIRCSAHNNYTEYFLTEGKKLLISRTLKETEEMLDGYAFLRVHHSHLVNLNAIARYA